MPTSHLLYLHGFRSSPQSVKARMLAARVARDHPRVHWWCPQLPPSPRAAMEMVLQGISAWPRATLAVAGSSLGGFYATWLGAQLGCRTVVLNPAVFPSRDLAHHTGEVGAWHDPQQRFVFEAGFVDELRAMEAAVLPALSAAYAVIAKGDEVLDWREMLARYPGARVRLLEGSDHAISDFDAHIDGVLEFLDLA